MSASIKSLSRTSSGIRWATSGAIHSDRNDEYNDGITSGTRASPFVDDVQSMMHRGNRLRERHFDHLLTELYQLVPDTEFSLGRLQ
jgi:hypothetical protein